MHAKESELIITRRLEAPIEIIWEAWTSADDLKKWWGPKDFTIPFCTVDLKVGGQWRYCMRSPNLGVPGADGRDYWGRGTYTTIEPNQTLAYIDTFTDENGEPVPASHYFGDDANWPADTTVTVTFKEEDGITEITLRHLGIPAGAHREGASVGWGQSFDKLAELVQ